MFVIRFFILIIITCPSLTYAATLYMGSGETHTNLQSAMSAMSAGDTLIIRNGTYTGSSNQITSVNYPPTSSTLWTTIRAENDGQVFFGNPTTGTNQDMFSVSSTGNSHWVFEGITWYNGTFVGSASYIKFLRCGSGTNVVTVGGGFIPFLCNTCSYVLYEDCHAWGGGRYMFSAYLSDHVIFRRCVGRTDACDTLHDVTKTEPIGGFAIYSSSYCEVQNGIIIDTDSSAYWNYESMPGAFSCPNGTGSNNYFRGCIALNGHMPSGGSANGFTSTTRINNVHWDMNASAIYGGVTTFNHCTIGVMSTVVANSGGINGYGATVTANNGIFYDLDGDIGAVYNVTSDYNYFYANDINFTGGSSAGSNDVINVDPTAGSLEYLVRIENGSTLEGAASDSGDVGATVIKRIGVSGTLWGETGYTDTTDGDLWPFPNEDIIRTNFRTYSHANIDGTRGFCATGQTLTKYIWEYLGNTIPCDIYGTCGTPNSTGINFSGASFAD